MARTALAGPAPGPEPINVTVRVMVAVRRRHRDRDCRTLNMPVFRLERPTRTRVTEDSGSCPECRGAQAQPGHWPPCHSSWPNLNRRCQLPRARWVLGPATACPGSLRLPGPRIRAVSSESLPSHTRVHVGQGGRRRQPRESRSLTRRPSQLPALGRTFA